MNAIWVTRARNPRPNLSHREMNFLAGVTETPSCRGADFKSSWILTSSVEPGSQLIFRFCLMHGFRYPFPSTPGLKRTNQNKRPTWVVLNLGYKPEVVTVTGGVCVSWLRLKVYLSSGRGQKRHLNQTSVGSAGAEKATTQCETVNVAGKWEIRARVLFSVVLTERDDSVSVV